MLFVPRIKSQHVAHNIFCENKKQRMLFGAATDAIWDILIFCEKNVGCFVCVYVGGEGGFSFHARTHGVVPRFTWTTKNTGTTTKHRNDYRNTKKKIPAGSGDDGGRGIKCFECIYK